MKQVDLGRVTTLETLITALREMIFSASGDEYFHDKVEIKRSQKPGMTQVLLERRQSSGSPTITHVPFAYSAEIHERLRQLFWEAPGWIVLEGDRPGLEWLLILRDNSRDRTPVGGDSGKAQSRGGLAVLPSSYLNGPTSPVTKKSNRK